MFALYTLGREWPWISGSLSEPLSHDFSGIVTEGFTIPETVFKNIIFVKLYVWLSNSNRIVCI